MIDHRTEKAVPNRIEGKGFIVLKDGYDKGPGYNSNVMLYKVIVYTSKKNYLISKGRLMNTQEHQSYIGKHMEGKCFVNLGSGRINITNHNLPKRIYKDWKGRDTVYKPTRWERMFYKYASRITEVTQDEIEELIVNTLL